MAAALSAVRSVKRSAPSAAPSDQQQGGAAKRAATSARAQQALGAQLSDNMHAATPVQQPATLEVQGGLLAALAVHIQEQAPAAAEEATHSNLPPAATVIGDGTPAVQREAW